MECPVCKGKTRVTNKRKNSRRRECEECLTRFSTREILIRKSIPEYIREKLVEG